MLEIYLGRDEIMGIHVGRIIHEFGEGAEHTDGSHRDNLFQKVLQSQRGQCVGSDDCYFGSCHNGIGLPAKVRIIFVSSLQCGEMNFTCMRNSAALIAAKAGLRLPHTVLRRYLPTRCRLHIRLPLRRETALSNGYAARCLCL